MTGYATRTPELYKLSKVTKFRYETLTSPNNSNYHYTVGRDRKDKNSFVFFFPLQCCLHFPSIRLPLLISENIPTPTEGRRGRNGGGWAHSQKVIHTFR